MIKAIIKAQPEASLIAFKESLLNTDLEVSNVLYRYQAASKKPLAKHSKSFFYKNLWITLILTAEQSLLAAQLNSISDKLQQLQATIALYWSLGGGWR